LPPSLFSFVGCAFFVFCSSRCPPPYPVSKATGPEGPDRTQTADEAVSGIGTILPRLVECKKLNCFADLGLRTKSRERDIARSRERDIAVT
jgi:hypothetical protein